MYALLYGNPSYEILNFWSQIFRETLFYNKNFSPEHVQSPHCALRYLALSHLQTTAPSFLPGRWLSFYTDPIHPLWPILETSPAPWRSLCPLQPSGISSSSPLLLLVWMFIWYLSHPPSIQWFASRSLITGSLGMGGGALICSTCQFLWCKYSCSGWFQAWGLMALNAVLGRDPHIWLSPPGPGRFWHTTACAALEFLFHICLTPCSPT